MTGVPKGRRARVLVGAYACGPDEGPESNAGWEFALAAARDHDVWVVTRPRFEPLITAALADRPDVTDHLRVEYLDLPPQWSR